jgi:stress response protein SCP2
MLLRDENTLVGMDIIVYMPEEFAKKTGIGDIFLYNNLKKREGMIWLKKK